MFWAAAGGVNAFVAIACGAFGAHALKRRLDGERLTIFETGARYQMYHALALIVFGLWVNQAGPGVSQFPGWAFTIGTLLFSGSLYALALTDIKILGAITPFFVTMVR